MDDLAESEVVATLEHYGIQDTETSRLILRLIWGREQVQLAVTGLRKLGGDRRIRGTRDCAYKAVIAEFEGAGVLSRMCNYSACKRGRGHGRIYRVILAGNR